MPVKIFFCYAHEDEQLLNELKFHLKTFIREGLIEIWYDRNISAGQEWAHEINNNLNTAEIILLLVSQYFIASDYCWSIEMMKAIERHKRDEAIVIPIILRPVNLQKTPFGKLRALPTDAEPVTSKNWANQDEAFFDVTEGIRKVIEKLMLKPTSSFPTIQALPIKTDWKPQQYLPKSDTSQLETEQRLNYQSQISQNYQLDGKTQANLFIQPPDIVNPQLISPGPELSASEHGHIETLYNEAVIAQSNGDLEKAFELYQQIRKQEPNFKKGQITSQLKKLLEQFVSEANRRSDHKSQLHYLKELFNLDTSNMIVQSRLEKASSTYISLLRKRASAAREGHNWEVEYKSLEEILKLRPGDVEANKYFNPAKVKYLRKQAKKARKAGWWDNEARQWSELFMLQPGNTEAKRRQAIALNNQDHIWMYENALQLEREGHPAESRETLERLWHDSPYYGDPKGLARKVGLKIPLPLEKWRRGILVSLIAGLLFLFTTGILLSTFHIDSTIAWIGSIAVTAILVILAKYWLLLEWLE